MIWNCQRKTRTEAFHIHRIEAPDERTARELMLNRSFSLEWLDPEKTRVWVAEGTGK